MPTADELLDELRPGAFAIAYRMLGSVSEAEDVVQEALLRLHRARLEGERIESPRAYVSTVVTRLGIDQLRSARRRRETYVGDWLPEPLVTSDEDDPARQAEMADSLSLAFLVLLESLSPEQRAAFLLREVFDYGYDEIARIVDKSEANARQLVTRARRHVEERRPRFEATREQHERLADRFFAAMEDGDVKALEAMLAEDVVLAGDGGGKAPALARALHGARRVARAIGNWGRLGQHMEGVGLHRVEVNGQPGAILLDGDQAVLGVVGLDIADGRVQAVRSVVNPEKLRHLGPVSDLAALVRQASRARAERSPGASPPRGRAG
jgi:RNA polymerase sigma-70 factor (TIGR02957 family)